MLTTLGTSSSSKKRVSLRADVRAIPLQTNIVQLPMAITALALLIAVMVAIGTASQVRHSRPANLPRAATPAPKLQALREDAMKITVARDGNVIFRNVQVVLADLPEKIRAAVQEGAEKKIYLAVDSRTKYVDVMPVIDQIRTAGILQIVILADQRNAVAVRTWPQPKSGVD